MSKVSVLWVSASLLLASPVFAQESGAQAEVGVKVSPGDSPAASIAKAEAIRATASRLASRIAKMLDDARRSKDIIRVNCLNGKLAQVNANSRTVAQRLKALKEAVNPDRRNHEFTVISLIGQKLQTLDQEASQCVGQNIFEPGAAQVVTTVEDEPQGINASTIVQQPPAPPAVAIPPAMSGTR